MSQKQIKVVVVGGGTMGADVAVVAARGGCLVEIIESNSDRALQLPQYTDKLMDEQGFSDRASLIAVTNSIDRIDWQEIDLVIECLPEKIEIKQELFKTLDERCDPKTILASNSSSFPISQIAKNLNTQDRMIGLHFFMPAHLIPCVEVVCGANTKLDVAEQLIRMMTMCGMVPVLVKKDLPGFLANRLQHALSREAFAMIDAGIASPEDIDKAVRFGFGFRYLAAGPVMQRDHAGIEIHAAAGASIYPSLNNSPNIANSLSDKVANGNLGMKSGSGFFEWTPQSIQEERKRYDDLLKEGLKILKKELPQIK
ncbi:MAG: 3-hydroxyacyl-CoA dehydrogenase NAD-binding domain-containing protein [Betaproteobacteria bacterium]